MYLEHFGLGEYPFSTSPDPRYYYPSAKHREALACLLYAVEQRKGFALVTGEVGAGKTMLCRAALERFGDAVEPVSLVHTSLSPTEFLQAVGAELGLEVGGKGRVELLAAIRDALQDRRRRRRISVLIVDEAQDLSLDVLEEVRLLGNLETSTEKLLQILLVGQPELRRLIGTVRMRPLDQRMAVKFHLGTLSAPDVDSYIEHRLRVAGGQGLRLFTDGAKAAVARASGGVPRVVNVMCDHALLQAFARDDAEVTEDTVGRVVAEMEGYYMDRAGSAPPPDRSDVQAPAEEGRSAQGRAPVRSRSERPLLRSVRPSQRRRAAAGTAGPPLRPGAAEGASDGFPDVAALCEALAAGRLPLAFPPPGKSGDLGRYRADDIMATVRLSRTEASCYLSLVARAPVLGRDGVADALAAVATDMGYRRLNETAFRRRSGGIVSALKLGTARLGVARPVATGAEAGSVAEAVRALHGDLVRLLETCATCEMEGLLGDEPADQVGAASGEFDI